VRDLNHGTQFTPTSVVTGGSDISVVKDSSVIIITAGARQKPGQTRLDLAGGNARILTDMVPKLLDVGGLKPWEVGFLDTMKMWSFGDHKNFTSLGLLTHLLGIPTPKDDISGADVARVYYEDKDLERIAAILSDTAASGST